MKLLIKALEFLWTCVFTLLMMLNPLLFCLFAVAIMPITFLIPKKIVKIFCHFADFVWWTMVKGLESWGGQVPHFYGDTIPDRESAVVMMNHVTFIDWLFVFGIAGRRGRLGCLKFFAKDSVKYWPGFGWGIYFLDSVFLKRDWLTDQAKINATFRVLRTRGLPFWMLSFVEGTRATPMKIAEGQEFSRSRNLPVLNNLIFPRTKGFIATVKGLRDSAPAVYDITFAFPTKHVPTLIDLAMRRLPPIHYHIRRFPMASLPRSDEELTKWVVDRFVEKDALLDHFKQHGAFPNPRTDWSVPYVQKPMNIWNM